MSRTVRFGLYAAICVAGTLAANGAAPAEPRPTPTGIAVPANSPVTPPIKSSDATNVPPAPPPHAAAVATNPPELQISGPNCYKPMPPASTTKLTAMLATAISWQPRDGAVRFTISATPNSPAAVIDGLQPDVRFGWPSVPTDAKLENTPDAWFGAASLRTISRTDTSITYEAEMPDALWAGAHPGFWTAVGEMWPRLWGKRTHLYDGWGFVPTLYMRVCGLTPLPGAAQYSTMQNTMNVGVSERPLALALTILGLAIAWKALSIWATARHVSGDRILRIIANRNNYASLSQFQLLTWTAVIAGGAVYVMALTGSLLDVPTQALSLLGISGVAALGAAYASGQTGQKGAAVDPAQVAPPIATPGVVRNLRAVSIGPTEAVLFWQPPEGAVPITSYEVTRQAGAGWTVVGNPNGYDTFFHLDQLAASTDYKLSVTARNANGDSDRSEVSFRTDAPAQTETPRVQILTAQLIGGGSAPLLNWQSPNVADGYIVQVRRSGVAGWKTSGFAPAGTVSLIPYRSFQMEPLDYLSSYEFRVAGVRNGIIGAWSNIATVTTRARAPVWSDLVVWDGTHEVDITRVQVLVFTVLSALFVILKIGEDSAIPEIPQGIIALMGIVNGVYLSAKFIPTQKP